MRTALVALALLAALPLASAFLPACASSGPADESQRDLALPRDQAIAADLPDQATSGDGPRSSCDLGGSTSTGERLFFAATSASGAPYAAERVGASWVQVPIAGSGFVALVATELAGRALVVGRQGDDALVGSLYEPCQALLPSPSALFDLALTAERPAPIGGGNVDLVFRGSVSGDQRLYHTRFDGSWLAPVALGNLLSTLPVAAVRNGSAVHAIFTGTDGNVYDGLVDASGGVAMLTGATSNRGPAAVVASDGTTHVVWKGTDTNLYWVARPIAGAYSVPRSLCEGKNDCLIDSNESPVVALDRDGAPNAAWVGKDGLVYAARLDVATSTWSAAMAASAETTALPPAIAAGLTGTELALTYVRAADGMGRAVDRTGGAFGTPVDLPGGALGSRPSLTRLGP